MPESLDQIAARTLAHYDQRAQTYWEGTRGHDVSRNIAALLQAIGKPAPLAILDFGCGPGRDLDTFTRLGHVATGLEGSPQLAAMARASSGCGVRRCSRPSRGRKPIQHQRHHDHGGEEGRRVWRMPTNGRRSGVDF